MSVQPTLAGNVIYFGAGAIGTIWGFPGMMIGLSIGQLIAGKVAGKHKSNNNADIKNTNEMTRLDAIPATFGTAMAPGQIFWFGQMSLLDNVTLQQQWAYDQSSAYFSSYYTPLDAKFAVTFGRVESSSFRPLLINHVFFDGKSAWDWCLWLGDIVKWATGALDTRFPMQIDNRVYRGQPPHPVIPNIPHKNLAYMTYTGWFGDYANLQYLGHNDVRDYIRGKGDYEGVHFGDTSALKRFPNINAEISGPGCLLSHDAFGQPMMWQYGRTGIYDWAYGSDFYGTRYGCRSGMHDYWYAINWHYSGIDGCWMDKFHPLYRGTRILDTTASTSGIPKFRDFTAGYNQSMHFDAEDEVDKRLYFFMGRVPFNDCRPYAPYSLEYDIFYIDLETELPVSVIDRQRITGVHDFEPLSSSTVHVQSVQVVGDELWAWAWIADDTFVLEYWKNINSCEEIGNVTRLYCDMSGVPEGIWDGWNCQIYELDDDTSDYVEDFNKTIQNPPALKILHHTATYIDLDGLTGVPTEWISTISGGFNARYARCKIQYAPFQEQAWVVADIGSTRSCIICNCPAPTVNDANNFYSVIPQRIQRYDWGPGGPNYRPYPIDYGATSIGRNIYLSKPLNIDPVPGDVFVLGYSGGDDGLSNKYYNPVVPSSMQNRYREWIRWPWWWDNGLYYHINGLPCPSDTDHDGWVDHYGIPTWDGGWRTGHVIGNTNTANKMIVLRFDKNTGAYLGEKTNLAIRHPSYHAWGDAIEYTTSVSSFISTVSTDLEINVTISWMGTPSAGGNRRQIIDKVTGNIVYDTGFIAQGGGNASGHASNVRVDNANWVWEYNALTDQFEKAWYASFYDWNNYTLYFAKLIDGRFSVGLDMKLARTVVYSGPLYVLWWDGRRNTQCYGIAKNALENKLYVYWNHAYDGANYSFGGLPEIWKYTPVSAEFPLGNLECIYQGSEDWLSADAVIGHELFLGTLSTVAPEDNGQASSYHCDTNPVQMIKDLLNQSDWGQFYGYNYTWAMPNIVYGGYADYDYHLQTNLFKEYGFESATELCNAPIVAQGVIGNELIRWIEPRYQYSITLASSEQFYSILKDAMQSCLGWSTLCQGLLRYVVPNSNEVPKMFFEFYPDGPDEYVLTASGSFHSQDGGVPVDVSGYPLGFFYGMNGYFNSGIDRIEFVCVKHSRTDELVLYVTNNFSLPSFFPNVSLHFERRDNIKENSFTFAQKSKRTIPNIIRIEHENRVHNYITDVQEATSAGLRQIDGFDKIQTYSMMGIKRASQASRVAQQLQDYLEFVGWTCAFETDLMGIALCPGVICGITHPVPGWDRKLFRLMSMEETGDDLNYKLIFEEYNPYVYHDMQAAPIMLATSGGGSPPLTGWTSAIYGVTHIALVEDQSTSQIWFGWRVNATDSNIIGVRVYRWDGSNWVQMQTIFGSPPTMLLAVAIPATGPIDYIEFNSPVGSIPTSGKVLIGGEVFYYNGVDTDNNRLMNVVRGVDEYSLSSHAVGSLITVWENVGVLDGDQSWAGTTQRFKLVPFRYGYPQAGTDITSAPEITISYVGYAFKPYAPESVRL